MLVRWILGGVLLSLSLLIWLTVGPFGLAVIVMTSLVVGEIAHHMIERPPPFGRLAGVNAGLIGGWLGGWFLERSFGPHFWGVALFPAIIGVVNARLLLEVVIDRLFARAERPDTN